jgi:hypothetical protein
VSELAVTDPGMGVAHMGVLYALLGLLGISLVGPGLAGLFRPGVGRNWLIADQADARSHLRGLNAMMAGVGMIAFWACWDLANSRALVLALGLLMSAMVIARLYSLLLDGRPGGPTVCYLAVEALLAAVFLLWPPPPV